MTPASSNHTPQGVAIRDVSVKFGDGETLPYAPCKKGYYPLVDGVKMYACRLHNAKRKKRITREFNTFRLGETPLDKFWSGTAAEEDSGDDSEDDEDNDEGGEETSTASTATITSGEDTSDTRKVKGGAGKDAIKPNVVTGKITSSGGAQSKKKMIDTKTKIVKKKSNVVTKKKNLKSKRGRKDN